jgi:hypothetical protein
MAGCGEAADAGQGDVGCEGMVEWNEGDGVGRRSDRVSRVCAQKTLSEVRNPARIRLR